MADPSDERIASLRPEAALREMADMIQVGRWFTLEEVHGYSVVMVGGRYGEPVDLPERSHRWRALAARVGLAPIDEPQQAVA